MIVVKKDFSPVSIRLETEDDLNDFIDLLQKAIKNEHASQTRYNVFASKHRNEHTILCETLLGELL